MKYLELLLSICLCFPSCKNDIISKKDISIIPNVIEQAIQQKDSNFDLGDFILIIDADEEDFDISKSENDTIKIEKALYKTLDGAIIKPKEYIKIMSVHEIILIDALQYTIDDNPATPLNLNIKKEIILSEINQYKLENIKTYSDWFSDTHLKNVKEKSINFQNDFFTKLQKQKIKYQDCCKEYLVKAENFLRSNNENLKSIEDLNTELFIKQRIIKINYKHDDEVKEKTLIYN